MIHSKQQISSKSNQLIIIRADASSVIGTGHVMRCLTLADELSNQSAVVSFICRGKEGNLMELIEKKGYKVYRLPADIDMETDSKLTREILNSQPTLPDWLIIDHYHIGAEWESVLRKLVKKVMVIDDLADRKHNCDLLLDQNYSSEEKRYQGLVPDNCIRLLGPDYALLRPQFLEAWKHSRERTGEVKRILVFMGGADPSNQTSKVLNAIKMLNMTDIATDVVIGTSNINSHEIENIASSIPNTVCHFNIDNMAKLMIVADLGIGACGTASWERCCIGLPTLVINIADNQNGIAGELLRKEAIIYSGWFEEVTEARISEDLRLLIGNKEKIRQMSIKAMDLVDGLGAKRIARQINNGIRN